MGQTTREWASPIFPPEQLDETQCWSMGTERQPSVVELALRSVDISGSANEDGLARTGFLRPFPPKSALMFYLFEEHPLRVSDMCGRSLISQMGGIFLEFLAVLRQRSMCMFQERIGFLFQTGYKNEMLTSETFDSVSAGSDSVGLRVQIKGAFQEFLI